MHWLQYREQCIGSAVSAPNRRPVSSESSKEANHHSPVMNCGTWEGCSPPGGLGQSAEVLGEQGQPAKYAFNRARDPLLNTSCSINSQLGETEPERAPGSADGVGHRCGHFGAGAERSPAAGPTSTNNSARRGIRGMECAAFNSPGRMHDPDLALTRVEGFGNVSQRLGDVETPICSDGRHAGQQGA